MTVEHDLGAVEFFEAGFKAITGHPPMRWQTRLFRDHFLTADLPGAVSIPTGLGKTAVMAVWLIALAWQMRNAVGQNLPRRLVYVVDRRAVVDQATDFAENLRKNLEAPEAEELRAALGLVDRKLPISTLRGKFVGNRDWLEDPASPAIIVGTVDMIGSRLLFEGYGVSRKMRPYHAGLIGADSLVLLDEAHLVPPFEALLETIVYGAREFGPRDDDKRPHIPPLRLLPLSATGRTRTAIPFQLKEADFQNPEDEEAIKRLRAKKNLRLYALSDSKAKLAAELAMQAWTLMENGTRLARCLIYCNSRQTAKDTREKLQALIDAANKGKRGKRVRGGVATANPDVSIALFVGARRVHERGLAAKELTMLGFLADSKAEANSATFLIATSAGEVGVDLDADHMVCDLVAWERMVQRLGRVNRRGRSESTVIVVALPPPVPKTERPSEPHASVLEEPKKPKNPGKKADQSAQKTFNLESTRYKSLLRDYKDALAEQKKADDKYPELLAKYLDDWADTFLYRDRVEAISLLAGDGSPSAIRALANRAIADEAIKKVIQSATTPPPLRPALTRPLIDAWSMTSLEEHTGRPRIDPWLRGWVSDPPQTTVLWRSHLPIRQSKPEPSKKELEAFFEAAAPHASELLETETFRVLDWLMKRTARFLGSKSTGIPQAAENKNELADAVTDITDEPQPEVDSDAPDEPAPDAESDPADFGNIETEGTQSPSSVVFKPDDIIGFVLSNGGDLERTLRLRDIPTEPPAASGESAKKQAADSKKKFEGSLAGSVLILTYRFGGLMDGLLDESANMDAKTADGTQWDEVPFRIFEASSETAVTPEDNWLESLRFDLERTDEGEAKCWLVVKKQIDKSNNEDDRASGPPQSLAKHQECAEEKAKDIAARLALPQPYARMLAIAARLHDEGKQAERWQRAFRARRDHEAPYAKTLGPINFKLLDGYRHEFGSLPYAQKDSEFLNLPQDLQDLALHLIAAHHGFARPAIGINGCDDLPPSALEARAREVALRFARLQKRWGPWGLAWWEALLRAADQQASKANAMQDKKHGKGNP